MSAETDAGVVEDAEDVEAMGRRLGEAIADLPEYHAFESARTAVQADEAAQARITAFENQRQSFMLARRTGEATEADLRDLQAAQESLHELPVMAEYLEAQAELVDRLEVINDAISEPLAIDFGGEAGGCCQD